MVSREMQTYVKQLVKAARGADSDDAVAVGLARVAGHCMHGLLAARPAANCSAELLQHVVPAMAHRWDSTLARYISLDVVPVLFSFSFPFPVLGRYHP